MSAPNLLRVGIAEKVFVEAQDYRGSGPLQVNILVSKFPSKSQVLTKTVTLTPEGNFQHVAEINVRTNTFFFLNLLHVSVLIFNPVHCPGYSFSRLNQNSLLMLRRSMSI